MNVILAWTLVAFTFTDSWNGAVDTIATPMATQELCENAGKVLQEMMIDTTKHVRFKCVKNQ